MISRLFFALLFLFAVPCVQAAELPGIPQFIDEMVSKHQFKRDELVRVFSRAERRQAVIDAISTPATLKPWPDYRASFINDQRISGGLQFWQFYAGSLQRAEKQYGVPQEIIVALIGVETSYGRNAGKYSTLDALATLAFDYPRRADFFRGELEQYLLLAREQGFDLFKVQGSYAGALGIPQFMPSSYRKYAVDFSGDGKIDLLHDPVDAIGSVANYLKQYGWLNGKPVTVRVAVSEDNCVGSLVETHTVAEWAALGVKQDKEIAANMKARLIDFTVADGKEFWLAFGNFDVITSYNNSDFYAMTVFQLAEALRNAHH
jgi:membrane-bound lytic murein transglycosylase B